jgi:cytosine/adenosine deaminase-related metal-dependent hydrolase
MTRYSARWVHPVTSKPIENGVVCVEHGRIVFVGAREHAPADNEHIDLGDVILMPGLVNAHCHLELTAMRGFLENLSFRDWILRLTMARRAVMTTEMMLDASRLAVEEGLQFGVTTFADTGDSGTGFDAMLEYGVRGVCYREVFGPDPAQCEGSIQELEGRLVDMLARQTALVRAGVSPHAPYTVSDALFESTARLAERYQVPVAVHIAESQLESDLVIRASGAFADGLKKRGIAVAPRARTPVALLERTTVLDRSPLLIHCVRVDDDDIASIVAHDCGVAHCPVSNAKLAHGIAPLAAIMAAGARVGIGTDSVASNDQMSLGNDARLAVLCANAREQRHDALTAEQAIGLLTLGGARALRLDGEVGSLEVGKAADLAAFPIPEHRAPVYAPSSALIHALAGTPADFVAVAGNVKVRNGRLLGPNRGLSARVQDTANRLREWQTSSEGRNAP